MISASGGEYFYYAYTWNIAEVFLCTRFSDKVYKQDSKYKCTEFNKRGSTLEGQ